MTSKIKVNILADGGDNSIITSDGAGSFTASSGLASSVQSVGGLQNTPAFLAFASQNSFSINTRSTVTYSSEVFDTDSVYNTSTYTFTVPSGKAGKYLFTVHTRMEQLDYRNDFVQQIIKTSNREYVFTIDPRGWDVTTAYWSFTQSVVADMDDSDTARIEVYVSGSYGSPLWQGESYFSGCKLIGA